jgi:hypothetical protein
MILFGLAEAFTALTHHSFGVTFDDENIAAYAGAAIGILYAAAGLLVFTMNRIAVAGSIVLLLLIIAGRIVSKRQLCTALTGRVMPMRIEVNVCGR